MILIFALSVSLCGCAGDVPSESVVDVVTVTGFDISHYHSKYYANEDPDYYADNTMDYDEIRYYSIERSGVFYDAKSIEPFVPDDIRIFTVVPGGIICDDSAGNSRGHYRIDDKRLFDENGRVTEMTDALSDVFDSILELEPHLIELCQIFKDSDEYFVYLELNVNWWYPCELYYYDKASGSLKLLFKFDNERIIGIKTHIKTTPHNSRRTPCSNIIPS